MAAASRGLALAIGFIQWRSHRFARYRKLTTHSYAFQQTARSHGIPPEGRWESGSYQPRANTAKHILARALGSRIVLRSSRLVVVRHDAELYKPISPDLSEYNLRLCLSPAKCCNVSTSRRIYRRRDNRIGAPSQDLSEEIILIAGDPPPRDRQWAQYGRPSRVGPTAQHFFLKAPTNCRFALIVPRQQASQ